MKRRKVEEEPKKGLSTSDKIAVGILGASGVAVLALGCKCICDCIRNNGSKPQPETPKPAKPAKQAQPPQPPQNSQPAPRNENPVGISNPRNACYINSIMQVLFRNRQFRKYVLHYDGQNQKVNDLKRVFEQLANHTLIQGANVDEIYRRSFGYDGCQNDPTVVTNYILCGILDISRAGYNNFDLIVYPNIGQLENIVDPPAFQFPSVNIPNTRQYLCTDQGHNVCAQFGAQLLKLMWFDREEILRHIEDANGIDRDEEGNFVRFNNAGKEEFKEQIKAYQRVGRNMQKKCVGQEAFDRYKRNDNHLNRSDMYKLFTPLLVDELFGLSPETVPPQLHRSLYALLRANNYNDLWNILPEGVREEFEETFNQLVGETNKQNFAFEKIANDSNLNVFAIEYSKDITQLISTMQQTNGREFPGIPGTKGSDFGLTGGDADRRFFATQEDYAYLVNKVFSGQTKTALSNMTLEEFQNLFQSQQEYAFIEAQLPTGNAEQFMVTVNRNLDVDHLRAQVTANPQMNIDGVDYTWTAAIVHSGGQNGGHYITYAIDNQGRWWRYSDDHVTLIEDINTELEQIYHNGTQFIYTRTDLLNGSYFPN